ncbi:MAG: LysR family transcriptional regulator, partial [Sneathiella sp.]
MAMHITLDQWRVFEAIVEEGGYAQAAQKLHRSQSAISYSIAKMQDQLGVNLLEIQGRKAVLTEAGTLL